MSLALGERGGVDDCVSSSKLSWSQWGASVFLTSLFGSRYRRWGDELIIRTESTLKSTDFLMGLAAYCPLSLVSMILTFTLFTSCCSSPSSSVSSKDLLMWPTLTLRGVRLSHWSDCYTPLKLLYLKPLLTLNPLLTLLILVLFIDCSTMLWSIFDCGSVFDSKSNDYS